MRWMLVSYTARRIHDEHMLVMYRAAQQLIVGGYEEEIMDFDHDLCSGRVYFKKLGSYGGTGGAFFHGDFGESEGRPNTVDFFIPRSAYRLALTTDALLVRNTYNARTGEREGYPEDIDPTQVIKGDLRLRPRMRG